MAQLLMVCMGNICRSPMAQVVGRNLAAINSLREAIFFDSAGTHVGQSGLRPDRRAEAALVRRGYEMCRIRSRAVMPQDFQKFQLILSVDMSTLSHLRRLCPPVHQGKLGALLDYAEGVDETNIPDPYYGSAKGFERTLELCEAGIAGLIKHYTL
jgi:protein-tyrosine phosphatase